jgi:hypothetical protein
MAIAQVKKASTARNQSLTGASNNQKYLSKPPWNGIKKTIIQLKNYMGKNFVYFQNEGKQ